LKGGAFKLTTLEKVLRRLEGVILGDLLERLEFFRKSLGSDAKIC